MNQTLESPKRPKVLGPAARKPVRTTHEIAMLPQRDIRRMSREDLVALIRLADVPLFRDRVNEHLPVLDRLTLERLAFLAQRTIRNQRG